MLRRATAILVLLLTLSSCATAPAAPMIRLSELHPLPVTTPGALVPLRISVASVISPRGTVESYQPLLDYLSARLGRPVELVQRRTYTETNELIGRGEVDVAFVCTSAYISGRDTYGMSLLAAPQVAGATTYHSLLLVPADSAARSMADLGGAVFAFTDPTSYSGRVYPTALVQELGETPEQFFDRIFYTYSHDDAINAVADGLADGAAVDSLVYDFAVARDPWLAERVRVIHRSPSFGIPPVVVGPDVRPQVRAELQAILFDMADDATPEAQAALKALGAEGFVPIDDRAYDSARAVVTTVGTLTP